MHPCTCRSLSRGRGIRCVQEMHHPRDALSEGRDVQVPLLSFGNTWGHIVMASSRSWTGFSQIPKYFRSEGLDTFFLFMDPDPQSVSSGQKLGTPPTLQFNVTKYPRNDRIPRTVPYIHMPMKINNFPILIPLFTKNSKKFHAILNDFFPSQSSKTRRLTWWKSERDPPLPRWPWGRSWAPGWQRCRLTRWTAPHPDHRQGLLAYRH